MVSQNPIQLQSALKLYCLNYNYNYNYIHVWYHCWIVMDRVTCNVAYHQPSCLIYPSVQKVRYSLTQGQTFGTIPELLQYYALQSHLPRSDFYLGDPYHPDDH